MEWSVLTHAEFDRWLLSQPEDVQVSIVAHAELLVSFGPNLGRPQVDTVKGSKHSNMKELRVQHQGDPYRILFAFDPKRHAILLLGGNKRGDKRWYKTNLPIARIVAAMNIYEHLTRRKATDMAKPLRSLIKQLPKTTQEKIRVRASELIAAETTLRELRKVHHRSQHALARKLRVNQAAVSKMERRTDMYVSTLRTYIEAMGGQLEIVATFPKTEPVRISQFEKLG
ncbi:MAG: type II toxin-antitoxin system RelE/ParE family toxin [Gemmatales bacterium]